MKAIRNVFRNLEELAEANPEEGLEYLRERILDSLLAAVLVFGLVALIPSLWFSFSRGRWEVAFVDLIAYVIATLFFLYRKKIPYTLRAILLVLASFVLGVFIFIVIGDTGTDLFWIFAVAPLASLLLGLRWGLVFSAANIVFLAGIALLISLGIEISDRISQFTLGSWLVYSANFVAANAVVTIPLGALIGAFFKSVDRQFTLQHDYQILFENNPLPMWVYDVKTLRFLAVNSAAVEHYGYTREEFESKTLKDIRPAEEVPNLQRNLETTAGQISQHSGPWKHIKKDGTIIDVEIYSHSLQFASREARLVLANDITERLQAQEQLRLSDQILQRVMSLVLVMEKGGKIIYASPASKEILGYRPEELLGDGWWQVTRSDPSLSETEKTSLRLIATGKYPISPAPYERPVKARNGETRWIEWLDSMGPNQTVIGVGRDITETKQLHQKTVKQLAQFRALSEIDRAILSNLDLQYNLRLLVENVVMQLGVDAANVMLYEPTMQTLQSVQGAGFRTQAFVRKVIDLGEGYAGKVAEDKQIIHVDQLEMRKNNPRLAKALVGEGFTSYYGIPLVAKGELLGVLEIFNRSALGPDEEWFGLLNALASRAALAIDTIKTLENLERSNQDLVLSYDATIEGWSKALDLRDKETEGHSQRVTELGLELARRIGLDQKQLVNFRRGALLHDIGKMGVPDTILFKPASLNEDEWVVMKQHTIFAQEMLQDIIYLKDAIDIPYSHHERWDGSGYPLGLKGESIPLSARIFAVADVFDALTSDRPYRKAWTKEKALSYIKGESGKLFDPKVVAVFLKYHLATKALESEKNAML